MLTSAAVIEQLTPLELEGWIRYYIGDGAEPICVEVLKSCVGLQ